MNNNMFDNLYEDIFNLYCKINEALQEKNIDEIAEFISPNLYNEYKEKELYLKENNLKYIFNKAKINKYELGSSKVKLFINAVENILDKDNNVIEGNLKQTKKVVNIGYIIDSNHFTSKCKNCNKYYKDINNEKCNSCNGKLLKYSYSIVIDSIKKEA